MGNESDQIARCHRSTRSCKLPVQCSECQFFYDDKGEVSIEEKVLDQYINKQDNGKPRWELVPMHALEGIPIVMADAVKPGPNGEPGRYKEHSWQSVEPKRYFAALLRHVADLQAGKFKTDDTGMQTIDAILTNAMFLSWFQKNGVALDLDIKFKEDFLCTSNL